MDDHLRNVEAGMKHRKVSDPVARLQVPVISVMFGCALALLGACGKPVLSFIEQTSHVFFKMISSSSSWRRWACSARSPSRPASTGSARSSSWATLVVLFYGTVAIFVVVVLGTVLRLACFPAR